MILFVEDKKKVYDLHPRAVGLGDGHTAARGDSDDTVGRNHCHRDIKGTVAQLDPGQTQVVPGCTRAQAARTGAKVPDAQPLANLFELRYNSCVGTTWPIKSAQ